MKEDGGLAVCQAPLDFPMKSELKYSSAVAMTMILLVEVEVAAVAAACAGVG